MGYIDATQLEREVHESREDNPHEDRKIRMNHHSEHMRFVGLIHRQPILDLQKIVYGEWHQKCEPYYEDDERENDPFLTCSKCSYVDVIVEWYKYCPCCGAKMKPE